jgi:hypothetical protein
LLRLPLLLLLLLLLQEQGLARCIAVAPQQAAVELADDETAGAEVGHEEGREQGGRQAAAS